MANAHQIATWRYEQIAPLTDASLDRARLRAAMREKLAQVVEWPQSAARKRRGLPPMKKPIPRSSLFRWLRAYRTWGFPGLMPKRRRDRGGQRSTVEFLRWIEFAICLLYEQPDRSLTQLNLYLRTQFEGYAISRSTLARHLRAHPAFPGIVQLRSGKPHRLYDLYEAVHPHECWQLDGKGPFRVRFVSGKSINVRVLTVLDDHSRDVLAAIVALEEDIAAAVRVFCMAAAKYGLPDRMQFDHGSAFDSHIFRDGLALLGSHRNWIKVKNPRANGKIEAYHRSLGRWFVNELIAQEVVDLEHLEQLLQAMIALLYNRHFHSQIGMTPEEKLAGRLSDRRIALADLERAFFAETTAKSHPQTGQVNLPNGSFRVPVEHAGQRSRFRYDVVHPGRAVLVTNDGREIELQPFERKPLPELGSKQAEKRGTGQLQKLLDQWRGHERPNAQPGFGLPEVFLELGKLVGRSLPTSEHEALLVRSFYRAHGPLPRQGFLLACERTRAALGEGRPLQAYLDDLVRQIQAQRQPPDTAIDHLETTEP
jgi:transposase InsO family protein